MGKKFYVFQLFLAELEDKKKLFFWMKFGNSGHSASSGGLPMRDKKRAQHTRFCRFTTSPLKRQTEHQGSYGHTLVVGFNSDNQLA